MIKLLQLIALILFVGGPVYAQDAIKGVVKDSDGATVVGATVQLQGTTTYSVTDANGQFTLAAPKQFPVTVRVSSVGFKPQEVEIFELDGEELEITVIADNLLSEVVVTSRRREETAQEVPIAISVLGGPQVEAAGAFNVNRVKELIPSVQLYSSNPRNTGINIRGIGSPFGLTNDGLDPGVGFYVDGVYYARPAATTFDFIDIQQIEVLRGPQGTLFGKNTTAGAFNITTRKASFKPGADFELSYGNYGYVQAKASVTGPLSKTLAARVSFSGTQRDGTIENVRTGQYVNDINNIGARAQLLWKPTSKLGVNLTWDASVQKPNGYAQVVAGVVTTKRPAYRQFNAIISDLGYKLPSENAFDRQIDHDTPWRSGNDQNGFSLNLDYKIGNGTLTATSAWRNWIWRPSNDRDFTGLQALAKSQNPAEHEQWSQEVRYSGQLSDKLSGVVGLFYMNQEVKIHGTEESGNAQWRFSQSSTSALWRTPGLFEGYGIATEASIKSTSAAAFANIDWEIVDGLHFQPGIRYNYDKKDAVYDRVAYGGLQTTDPALLALKNGVYSSQSYASGADETNFTYNLTVAYRANQRINGFASYSTSYKPVGVNVAGLPTINNQPATDLAVIKPEYVKHIEVGVKTTPVDNFNVNLTFHNTDIDDYQTNVQSPELGVNRGYIANAEKVNVKGLELDANLQAGSHFSFYGSAAYTDGKYVTFTNAPLPLEETGLTVDGVQVAFKDVSGERLPGISRWATSIGGEFTANANFLRQSGKFFIAFDTYYRSEFSSSPSPSEYLNIDGYVLVNGRLGFRVGQGTSISVWSRNLANKNYYEQLLVAGGNAGQYAGVLGDPRTYGITLKHSF
ncbi:MAG TPA: TonB-dependent receptor [Cyclobacteriaceae bacterium]|nr:TonB-dependent receptor [Cyclobacteriaceae bacterium]